MEYTVEEKPSLFRKLKNFIKECMRILKITKKPTTFEFKTIVKVTGLGIIVIGFLGFVIQMIKTLLLEKLLQK